MSTLLTNAADIDEPYLFASAPTQTFPNGVVWPGLFVAQSSPPANTANGWLDTLFSPAVPKYYDTTTGAWTALVAASTLAVFAGVQAVVTTNVADLTGPITVGGVEITTGRILLAGQTTGSQNGIWCVASGAWTRPADYISGAVVSCGALVFVAGATDTAGQLYALWGTGTVTVDVSATTWVVAGSGDAGSVTGTAPIAVAAGVVSIAAATESASGSMSAADKVKLDGIAAGATVAPVTSVVGDVGAITAGQIAAAVAGSFDAAGAAGAAQTAAETYAATQAAAAQTAAETYAAGLVSGLAAAYPVCRWVWQFSPWNCPLSGLSNGISAGDVVLCGAQTVAAQNGPWVAAAGAWSRPSWYASGADISAPFFVTVEFGLNGRGSTWVIGSGWGTIIVDTTPTFPIPAVDRGLAVAGYVFPGGVAPDNVTIIENGSGTLSVNAAAFALTWRGPQGF